MSEFIQYAFIGKRESQSSEQISSSTQQNIYPIEELNTSSEPINQTSERQDFFILVISWVALGIFLISFVITIFYQIFRPNEQLPCIFETLLTAPLTYLSGVLATFWKKYTAT